MYIFTVVIDKRYLRDYMDSDKLHRKSWELLLERIQWFLQTEHKKHKGLMVTDDTSKQLNLSLAEKHSYFQINGTTSGMKLNNIIELPHFTRSEFSNGIQLADLCSYNIYRAFKYSDIDYSFFKRIESYIWSNKLRSSNEIEGMKIFPDESPLNNLKIKWVEKLKKPYSDE